MIRLTWMQSRLSALLAVAGLVAVAIVLGATGPHLVHLYDSTVVGCGAHGDCSTATSDFLKDDRGLQVGLDVLIVVVPGILGLFWGHHWSPASWRPVPGGWPGPRASPGPDGWPSSSASSAWPAWLWPGSSA